MNASGEGAMAHVALEMVHTAFTRSYLNSAWLLPSLVNRCGLAVKHLAGKQKDLGSICFGSPFSSHQKLWFLDTIL